MVAAQDDVIRYGDLIWRFVCVRTALLVVAGTACFATWSYLGTGDEKVRGIEASYVDRQAALLRDFIAPKPLPELPKDSPLTPEVIVVGLRRVLPVVAGLLVETKDTPERTKQFALGRERDLDDLDRSTHDAYSFPVSIPSISLSFRLNAIDLAEWWPLAMVVLYLTLLAIAVRQRALAVMLSLLVYEAGSGPSRQRVAARSGFFAGRLARVKDGKTERWLYSRSSALLADSLVLGGLTAALPLLSVALIFHSHPTYRHPVRSMLVSYYSLATVLSVCAVIVAVRIRRRAARDLTEALGGPVEDAIWWHVRSAAQFADHKGRLFAERVGLTTAWRLWNVVALSVAGAGLCLPWVVGTGIVSTPVIRGYGFLWRVPTVGVAASGTPALFFLPPGLFAEMRAQTIAVVAFLVVCLLTCSARSSAVTAAAGSVRRVMSWVILFLVGNCLVFLGIVVYEATSTNLVAPIVDMLLGSSGAFVGSHGLPLALSVPGVGLFTTMAACVTLAFLPNASGRHASHRMRHRLDTA